MVKARRQKSAHRKRKAMSSRAKLRRINSARPRLSVFRSAKNIYCQIIDDETGRTLASSSSMDKQLRDDVKGLKKTEIAAKVGEAIAGRAKEAGVAKVAFDRKDLDTFAKLMDEHWMHKKKMSATISLSKLDKLYDQVKKEFNVLGGKIIGAGGGGFIMLYTPDKGAELDEFMAGHGMPRINYFPSQQGTRVVTDLSPIDDFGYQG